VASAGAAHAQAPPGGGAPAGWAVGAGGGAIVTPAFRGASTYRVRPVPALAIRHGDDFTLSGLEASYAAVRAGAWRAGAQARDRVGQQERDTRVARRGLGDVGASVELGAFLSRSVGAFTVKGSYARDVAGGHDGGVATLGASYSAVLGRTASGPVLLNAGPSATWGSSRFNRSYYGVNAAQSARSGLAAYRPGSGFESVGVSTSLVAPVSGRVTFVALAGLERLVGVAARSPRVRAPGSRNQASLGAFLTYRLF
jgi:outer membrane scaffolding protein for murein synthesis (MipA/OmpV family)